MVRAGWETDRFVASPAHRPALSGVGRRGEVPDTSTFLDVEELGLEKMEVGWRVEERFVAGDAVRKEVT